MPLLVVRPYRSDDRTALRRLACDTADCGEPVEHFFRNRDVFADLLTRYYVEYEPQSVWIAESEGEVVGYLTGCLDSRRYDRLMSWPIIPCAIVKAIGRGALWQPESWRLLWSGIRTGLRGGLRRVAGLKRYSAHLHVNLRQDVRGQRIGDQLVERFLSHARAARVTGLYAPVRGDNARAQRFFERLGFTELIRHRVVFPGRGVCVSRETIIYGKTL